MADLKKDTVRIALPTRPEQVAADPNAPEQDTTPIVLPSRPPVPSIRRLPPKITPALSQPLPKPQGIEPGADATIRPLPLGKDESAAVSSSVNRGPKKETARIHPTGSVPVQTGVFTSRRVAPVEAIPRSLAWGLIAVSVVIFLIQIWNYVVS